MTSKKELQVAYGMVVVFLFVGILCFSVLSPAAPDQPVRIMFQSTAGKILFDHQVHLGEEGYGIECLDCHHNIEEDDIYNCSECHESESDDEEMPSRPDAFHSQCIDCHDDQGGPAECAKCHII